MKTIEKPVYKEPKVFSLDEREASYGNDLGTCSNNGSSADNDCYDVGNSAVVSCDNGTGAG